MRSRWMFNPTLLLVATVWGTGNLATKWVLGVFDPSALLAVRMGTVAILMAALLLFEPWRRIAFRDWLMLGAVGGAIVAAQALSFAYAMKMTTASEGSLLISTAPVWTAVLVAVLGMEHITGLNWMGIAVASCGVAMIVLGPGDAVFPNAPARLGGDLLMLASAWLYGGYMVLAKRWMPKFGALPVVCHAFVVAGVVLALAGVPQLMATDWSTITTGHWLAVGHATVLAGFVGVVLWYRTIDHTSASGTAVYQYLVPGVSILGAAVLLDERVSALQIAGIAAAMVGVYLARVPARAEEQASR